MNRNIRRSVITTCLSAVILMMKVNGHGLMCTPRQRGAYSEKQRCGSSLSLPGNLPVDYCPHCLNKGGVCGSPDHMIGGSFVSKNNVPIVETYTEGDQINLQAEIDTNHNGYFEFHLCDLDSCGTEDLHRKCFVNKHCYKLERVAHPDCENPDVDTTYECGPIDEYYPSRWYLPCRKTGHVGVHIVGGKNGYMRYKLPEGVRCKHCVIQWYWQTANSCNPPGTKDYFQRKNMPFGSTCPGDGGARGAHAPHLGTCENGRGEQFWSCADVSVNARDGIRGTNKKMSNDSGISQQQAQPPLEDQDNAEMQDKNIMKRRGNKPVLADVDMGTEQAMGIGVGQEAGRKRFDDFIKLWEQYLKAMKAGDGF